MDAADISTFWSSSQSVVPELHQDKYSARKKEDLSIWHLFKEMQPVTDGHSMHWPGVGCEDWKDWRPTHLDKHDEENGDDQSMYVLIVVLLSITFSIGLIHIFFNLFIFHIFHIFLFFLALLEL